MIIAKVILDSVNEQGNRLTTLQLRYPKFIHGEFMTHRVFSRNASSARAIPTKRLLEEVRSDELRAEPIFWGKNQAGMQAAEELNGEDLKMVQLGWKKAAFEAATHAEIMMLFGAHKQIVNRLLEPFLHINIVCTATEYANFFGLRLDKAAQPEMRALAEAMWIALRESKPTLLKPGEWHLPFVNTDNKRGPTDDPNLAVAIKVSVARCARVSYLSFDTGRRSTIEEDLALYDKLMGAQPIHASPAEHQATPDKQVSTPGQFEGYGLKSWARDEEWGNFVGWRQYRKLLPGEDCAPLPEEYR